MMESRLRRLALALLEASAEAEPEVQQQLREALSGLGDADPEELLECCGEFLRNHDKLPAAQRALVLSSMGAVVRKHLPELGRAAAAAAIALGAHELCRAKEAPREWQEAAGALLVELGRRFLGRVMEELLRQFPPGALPQPGLVRTLAELAAANVFGMVPFLSSILGTLLPLLGTARADSMKCTLCYALQRFSESIQEYLAGKDQAPDPTIRGDAFAPELGAAFDLLSLQWLQSRDSKVRQAVLEALGALSSLIPEQQLQEQLPRLLPALLGLYRKQPEPFPISKSLCQLLEASVARGSRSLEPQLEPLLSALLNQICSPADPKVPTSSKNHAELLRCCSVLAGAFAERLLQWLLPRLECSSERHRQGALRLLRHLLYSAPSQMEMQKISILSALKVPLQDGSPKVRGALVQLLSALAHRGFLQQPGAELLLEFLLQQCALPPHGPPGIPEEIPEDPSSDDVRSVSVSTLILLSSTLPSISHLLWNFLLPQLLRPGLGPALPPLCRSLALLAPKILQEPPENRAQPEGALPSPQALTLRLLVISCQPGPCAAPALRLLQELRLLHELRLQPQLGELWQLQIPKLLQHLQENSENSPDQEEWEEKLLQFFQESLESIQEKSWICPLVTETSRQLRECDGSREEKTFLYLALGVALGLCPSKGLVRQQLQQLLESARYQHEADREGLSRCFGSCARRHLEETLEKLEEFGKSEGLKKSQGLFSIFKERGEGSVEQQQRGALVLCLGRVAAAAPPQLLRSRLEPHLLQQLLQHGHTKVLGIKVETKDPVLKLCLARSISMISRALACGNAGNNSGKFGNDPGNDPGKFGNCPGNGPGGAGSIACKAQLVALMVEFLRAEPPEAPRTRLRQSALSACAHLVALEPPLSDSERSELLDTALASVLALPPPQPGKNHQDPPAQDLLPGALGALSELLRALLQRRLSPLGLQEIFQHLRPWIRSPRPPERLRALGLSKALLGSCLRSLRVTSVTPFQCLGSLLALLAPRCSDGIPQIRRDSLDCVGALLRIHLCYQGFSGDHRDELLEGLEELKEGLENPNTSDLFHTCSTIGLVLGRRIPPEQLLGLLLALLEAWEDPERNCARAAAAIGNALIRERGGILQEKVPELLAALHGRLAALQEQQQGEQQGEQGEALQQLRRAAQSAVLLLALQHPQAVVGCLLGSALPFDRPTRCLWRALGWEAALASQVLEQLLERLSREIPFKESKPFLLGSAPERVATALPLAATLALDELMSVPEAAAAVLERFPALFAALLLRLGCTLGVRLPRALQGRDCAGLQPCSGAVQTLRAMLARAGNDDVVQEVASAGGWELIEIPERHHDGIALLASFPCWVWSCPGTGIPGIPGIPGSAVPTQGHGSALRAPAAADRPEPDPGAGERPGLPEGDQQRLPGRAPQPQRGERPGAAGAHPGRADGSGEGFLPPGAGPGAPGARERGLGIPGKDPEARLAAAGFHGQRHGRQGRSQQSAGTGGHVQPLQNPGSPGGAGRAIHAAPRRHPHPALLRQRARGAPSLLHPPLREPVAIQPLRLRGALGADPQRAGDAAAAPAGPAAPRGQGLQVRPEDVRAQPGLRGAAGNVWESPAGREGAALRGVHQRRLQVPDAQPPLPAGPPHLHQPLLLQEPLAGAAGGGGHVRRVPGAAHGRGADPAGGPGPAPLRAAAAAEGSGSRRAQQSGRDPGTPRPPPLNPRIPGIPRIPSSETLGRLVRLL